MASENIICAYPGIITDASKFLHLCKKMIWELLRFEKKCGCIHQKITSLGNEMENNAFQKGWVKALSTDWKVSS